MNFRRCFRVFVLAVVLIGIRIAPVGANSRATIAAVAPVLAGPLILTASVSSVPNTILATQIGTAFVWGAIIQKIPHPTIDPNDEFFGMWLDRHPYSAGRYENPCHRYAQSAVLGTPQRSPWSVDYLVRPPLPHLNANPSNTAPFLSHWIVVKTFPSLEECEAHRASRWSQCIASDDPRLNEK
jgi:hypothetical protein